MIYRGESPFAKLRGRDTCGHYHEASDCIEYSKKSLLKSSNAKKYLPNFPTPKNPEINNYKPKVGHRVTSLEIKSILPPPLPWDFYDG